MVVFQNGSKNEKITLAEAVRELKDSATDPIVMLKHFGPGNPDLKG